MGGRAECVMLNKGPHILDAMRTLNDILQRMQAHQSKKRPLLRALRGWNLAPDAATTSRHASMQGGDGATRPGLFAKPKRTEKFAP
jgi:pyruvate kinase